LTDQQILENPFFRQGGPIDELIPDATMVTNYKDRVLAEAIPALTSASGMKINTGIISAFNYDMQNTLKTKNNGVNYWPRPEKPWLHSDVKNVAYPYIYQLFNSLIAIGGLNQ
jgi:hypothetical protein